MGRFVQPCCWCRRPCWWREGDCQWCGVMGRAEWGRDWPRRVEWNQQRPPLLDPIPCVGHESPRLKQVEALPRVRGQMSPWGDFQSACIQHRIQWHTFSTIASMLDRTGLWNTYVTSKLTVIDVDVLWVFFRVTAIIWIQNRDLHTFRKPLTMTLCGVVGGIVWVS